jgi:hypothetical protein
MTFVWSQWNGRERRERGTSAKRRQRSENAVNAGNASRAESKPIMVGLRFGSKYSRCAPGVDVRSRRSRSLIMDLVRPGLVLLPNHDRFVSQHLGQHDRPLFFR